MTLANPTFSGSGNPGDTLLIKRTVGTIQATLVNMTIGSSGTFAGELALVPGVQTIDYSEFSGTTLVGDVTRTIIFDDGTALRPPGGCPTCPPTSATPELDSILLFGIGRAGLGTRGRKKNLSTATG